MGSFCRDVATQLFLRNPDEWRMEHVGMCSILPDLCVFYMIRNVKAVHEGRALGSREQAKMQVPYKHHCCSIETIEVNEPEGLHLDYKLLVDRNGYVLHFTRKGEARVYLLI